MEFRVRDRRRGNWFWVENAILDQHGKGLGPYGLAVYFCLCRFADNETQECWPGRKLLAELTGMSDRQVTRQIAKLEQLELIEVERHMDNRITYHLLKLSYPHLWTHSPEGSRPTVQTLSTDSPLNKTQLKRAHTEEEKRRLRYTQGPYAAYIQH